MRQNQNKHSNQLLFHRRRRHLGQKYVASVLRLRDRSMVSKYENGHSLPKLVGAIKLEVLYQATIRELFPDLYEQIEGEINIHRSK